MAWAWDPFLLPALCRTCHGTLELDPGFAARCAYCGREDRLPANQLERALELKDRLAAAARVERQLSGTEELLVRRYEQPRQLTMMGLSIYLFSAWMLAKYFTDILPPLIRGAAPSLGVVVLSILPMASVLSIPLGMWMGFTWGRWRYRRDTRPLLFARPPAEPGQAARCRVCGAPLPPVSEPVARCLHCTSLSLLTGDLHQEALRRTGHRDEGLRGHAGRVSVAVTVRGRALAYELGWGWAMAIVLITLTMTLVTLAARTVPR
ncbi:hypothetical protein ATI61_118106 [Archangium gephyra]|uniref:Uncharacterized protein n=1 Tax=Archangium gephyra TaxID=48 RepID=A0AAC8Q9G9_9BACT|nr:hypothetical protein [Archangium gephyra]AKJ03224.1 Hypothetical protein AA314_04850 [Archangium gephyra]REG22901.1 hypothetical protein ATI61_118106 [Archangium gephyra]